MDDHHDNTKIDVRNLQHSEDLLKVEDIIIDECEAKDAIGFRFTDCPLTKNSVTPNTYLYTDKYNPTKDELDQLDRTLRKKYATARGLSMFTTEAKAKSQAKRLAKSLMDKDEDEAEVFMEENSYLVKFVIPASAGVVTEPHKSTKHFNFFPNKDIDVFSLMDITYGYKKIDYDINPDK